LAALSMNMVSTVLKAFVESRNNSCAFFNHQTKDILRPSGT
jgi:hypothetical protein